MRDQPFYRFRAEAGDEPTSAELLIFAPIGDWEDFGEVSAKQFATDLSKLPSSVKRLDIHINSPGGSVFEAQAIYSRLADHRSDKVVYVDGLAASAASIVAMVGQKIYIRANANMMIHLPSGFAMGNADDMRTLASALDSITESMINVYAKRTGLDRDELRDLLAAETWFSPQDAVEKGFADEVRGVVKAAAIVAEKRVIINGIEHDLSRFHNVPAFTAPTSTKEQLMKPKAQAPAAPPEATPDPAPEPTPAPTPTPSAPAPASPGSPTPTSTPAPAPAPQPAKPAAVTDYDKGVEAERERVSALQKLDKPATHDIVTKAIAEGKTVSDIAADCVEALGKAGAQSARRTDASALNNIPGSDAGNAEENTFGDKLKNAVAARMKNRNSRLRVNSRN
jgi:ATP-dependent Clp protease, protease subunit